MSFRVLTFEKNKVVSKTNKSPKQKTETLSLCERADAVEILFAGAEIFLSHKIFVGKTCGGEK